jgi:Lar family restriction alleviation protein
MTDEMKPCPFCGGDDIHLFQSKITEDWVIQCHGIGCWIRFTILASEKDEVVAAWNRRAEPKPKEQT